MKIRTLLGIVVLFTLFSCAQKPKLKGFFDLDVDLQGLGITNRTDFLDQFASIKPLPKKVGSVDPTGMGKREDIEVRYGDAEHITVIVDINRNGNISVTGLLFDNSYDEFQRLFKTLIQELNTSFSNRVRISSSVHRVDDGNYE